jgi:hypothetical protein
VCGLLALAAAGRAVSTSRADLAGPHYDISGSTSDGERRAGERWEKKEVSMGASSHGAGENQAIFCTACQSARPHLSFRFGSAAALLRKLDHIRVRVNWWRVCAAKLWPRSK